MDHFLTHLKLTSNYEIILITSLAYQSNNLNVRNKASGLLKKLLKNHKHSNKQLEFPQNFILFFVKFFKENHKEYEDIVPEIQYLCE